MNLFIDDERLPEHVFWIEYPDEIKDWVIVRNYKETIEWVEKNGLPDFISFDNDLGPNSKEGYNIAQFIVEYCLDRGIRFPNCAVHSQNNIARERIVSLINSYNSTFTHHV